MKNSKTSTNPLLLSLMDGKKRNLTKVEITETLNEFKEHFETVIAVSKQNSEYRMLGILDNDEGSLYVFDGGGNTTSYTKGEIDECFEIHKTFFV